jgi:hypothetical protein
MSHFEDLLIEYYRWQGYVVAHNINVGKRPNGGFEGELDIVAYSHTRNEIRHVEPSLDADSWAKRELRYQKKFEAGQKYIRPSVFPWADSEAVLTQIAVFPGRGGRADIAGGLVCTIDECVAEIKAEVERRDVGMRAAIPEQYPLLRTIQFVVRGYARIVAPPTSGLLTPQSPI